MKKIVYIIILLSLVGCNKSADVKSVLVNIEASGEIQLVPDIASIAVNVSCTDKDLSKSTECTRKNIDELFSLLEENKIDKNDYHSSRIDLTKEYIWKNNSQVFNGYKSSSTINILFKNLDTMSTVITKIMTMKNASLYNLNYSHSEIETFTNKAYLKALDNSKTLSNEIKDKLGGKSVEISQISNISGAFDTNESGLYEKKEFSKNRSNSAAPIQINPGALKIVKDIYVQYRITF